MSILKKTIGIILSTTILLGASACMVYENKKINYDEKIAEMTQYIEEKYNEEFEFIEFIPAVRGFNDGMNYHTLTLKMENKDIYTNVREKMGEPEEYYDDLIHSYTAYLVKDYIDYSGISDLNHAKTYLATRLESSEYQNLKNGKYKFRSDLFYDLECIISIKSEPSEKTLKELYDLYLQQQEHEIDIDNRRLIVSFGGDLDKGKMYVNNYYAMIKYQNWFVYDRTITHYIDLSKPSLSYEEFCGHLKENPPRSSN